MNDINGGNNRYFLSYSGVKLPLNLVSPLTDEEVGHRNTYYHGVFNDQEQLLLCQKIVYGEVEQEHRYIYYDSGALKQAEIIMDEDDVNVLHYDEQGNQV